MKIKSDWKRIMSYKWLYVMLIPGVVYYALFKFGPMFGLIAAFKNYQPFLGFFDSEWVGLKYFIRFFTDKSFMKLLGNTLTLSLLNLAFFFPMPILVALLLNEVKCGWFKRTVQSVVYLPHFLSWVVIVGISYTLFTSDGGIITEGLKKLGIGQMNFLTSPRWLKPMVVIQNIWKETGWGTIIFLAALAGVNMEMYEAAELDGASRLQQAWYITLPAIKTTIITMLILRLGHVMESGFDQLYNMQNAMNRDVADVFDTYVYRMGLVNGQLSYSTAVGLFKSLVGLFLVLTADKISKKVGEEGIL
ncbi:ABC transporter permease [Lacrimispora sp.]|uniref:ABC transporter permease n=1 Tax=Lacrimispora sp. TaxID=2719234 RepID=UPI0028AB4391|nr:ABC transporter permease subunit [Lacrimispora sp.]